jgi:hypothetical protein
MIDKLVLSTDKNNPNVFFVYQEGYNKWQVNTVDGRSIGTAASLDQVEGVMKNKMYNKKTKTVYPSILCLHCVDALNNINTHPGL